MKTETKIADLKAVMEKDSADFEKHLDSWTPDPGSTIFKHPLYLKAKASHRAYWNAVDEAKAEAENPHCPIRHCPACKFPL